MVRINWKQTTRGFRRKDSTNDLNIFADKSNGKRVWNITSSKYRSGFKNRFNLKTKTQALAVARAYMRKH